MDVRIGVTQAPRELTLEVDDAQHDDLAAAVDAALAGDTPVLRIVDRRGKTLSVPSAKIAYVELGAGGDERRIGFGS